jgi:hypothetical protein
MAVVGIASLPCAACLINHCAKIPDDTRESKYPQPADSAAADCASMTGCLRNDRCHRISELVVGAALRSPTIDHRTSGADRRGDRQLRHRPLLSTLSSGHARCDPSSNAERGRWQVQEASAQTGSWIDRRTHASRTSESHGRSQACSSCRFSIRSSWIEFAA